MADDQQQPQQPMIMQMVQDPDFGKLAPAEQRKALSAHDPMFKDAGDADIMRFVSAHKAAAKPFEKPAELMSPDEQMARAKGRSYGQTSMSAAPKSFEDTHPVYAKMFGKQSGFNRFLSSAGIPTSQGEATEMVQNALTPQTSPTAPSIVPGAQRIPIVGGIIRAQDELLKSGHPYGAIPVIGSQMARGDQQIKEGDYAGAAGSAVNVLLQLFGAKAALEKGGMLKSKAGTVTESKPYVPSKPEEAMSSLMDSKAGKVDPMNTAKSVTETMRGEAQKMGIKKSDFKGREGAQLGHKIADKAIETHQEAINKVSEPFLKDKVDMRPIGKAIRSEITDELKNNEPTQAARLEAEAAKFDRDGTVEELNDYRLRSNKEQQAYYKKGQTAQIMSESDIQAQVKGANAARDIQYNAIGNKAGIDPEYIRGVFKREGDLIDARNSLNKHYNNASLNQSEAVSQSLREKTVGIQGRTSLQDAKAQILKGTLGMKPIDALNARLGRVFGNNAKTDLYNLIGIKGIRPQGNVPPPAPGGVPPIGPNRLMLSQGATPLGPSSLAEQKLLGTGEPSGDITLHQPPIDAPTQMRDAAVSNISGRDKATGRFNRAYTTSPKTPFDEQPIYQYPGVMQDFLTKPKPESISQARFNAILKDIENSAAKRQSPEQPVPVKDSVFKHIQDAQKAKASEAGQQAPVGASGGQQTPSGEIIHPDDLYDPDSPHFIGDDPYYFGDPNNTDPTKGFVNNITEGSNPRTIEGSIIPKGQKALKGEQRIQYPDFRKALEKKNPSEVEKSVYFDKVSGMPNAEAFNVAEEQSGKAKAYGRSDADGLKLFNDTYGYAAGNELLKAKAEALKEAGLEAYHEKGDEFMYRGNTEGELRTKLENARRILKDRVFEVTDQQTGEMYHLKNLDFSYGTGGTLDAAEAAQHAHKTAREAAGERARGKLGTIIKTDQGTQGIGEGTPAQEAITQLPQLRNYADKIVNKGNVESVSLVGSTAKGALGRDTDIVYDFGSVKLPSGSGEAETALEKMIENEDIDLDKHDTFIKADGRYFHVSSGAGRELVENTEYGKAQEGKPTIVLAKKSK